MSLPDFFGEHSFTGDSGDVGGLDAAPAAPIEQIFDPRPPETSEAPTISAHVTTHDFGSTPEAPTASGSGFGPVDRYVVPGPGLPPTQTAPTE